MKERRSRRGLMITLFLAVAVTIAGGCGGDDEPQPASGNVVLYTSMPEAIIAQLEGVFEGDFPDFQGNIWIQPDADAAGGITLEVVRGRTADIEALLADELTRGGMRADVIWLAEPSPYESYKDRGLLATYEPPEDAPIPSAFVDSDGYYVAGRIISMVLAWNLDRHPDPLEDWPDLAEAASPAFPGPGSGAARATIRALMDEYGTEFFTDLLDGGGVSVPSNGEARDGVVAGTFDAVAVLDYMVRLARAEGAPIDYAYPTSGTVVIPSPLAINSNAANPTAAHVFVDYVLSQTGQEIVVQLGSFYPVRTDVATPSGAPPLDSIPTIDVDWRALAAEIDLINNMWSGIYGP